MPQIIPVGGASWTLDLCETRLNHAISLKGETRGDNIFTFYTKFSNNCHEKTWAILLYNDLDLLLPFEPN